MYIEKVKCAKNMAKIKTSTDHDQNICIFFLNCPQVKELHLPDNLSVVDEQTKKMEMCTPKLHISR